PPSTSNSSTRRTWLSFGREVARPSESFAFFQMPIMDLIKRAGDDVNLVVFENIQPIVWITTIPFFVICLASSAIRLYTRAFIRVPFGTDDWFILAGTVNFEHALAARRTFTNSVLDLIHRSTIHRLDVNHTRWRPVSVTLASTDAISYYSRHITDPRVKTEDLKKISVYLFAEEFYYLLLQFFIKMSFLFFYRRTLEVEPGFKLAVVITMALVCLQIAGTWVFYALQCIPIQAYFHSELYPNAKCISSSLSYYLPSVANVFMDVVIYLLPIYPLWTVQTPVRRQIGLICVFTCGGCTVMVSLLRFIVLWQLANTKDTSYIFGSVTIVTSIEFAVAIITANMPGMYAFYRAKISKAHQSSTAGYNFGIPIVGSKGRSLGNTIRVTNGSKSVLMQKKTTQEQGARKNYTRWSILVKASMCRQSASLRKS
ncbi:hypothetical protein GT037_008022, partial [Alternaria burnsii]